MSTATATPTSTVGTPSVERKGNVFVKWITTTDHKTIGYLYLITSFIYFLIGGVLTADAFTLAAQLLPASLAGVFTGIWLSHRVSVALFRRLALFVVVIAGVGAAVSGVVVR